MKVLFLPENIASMPALTAEVLNRDESIQAVCITNTIHKYQTISPVIIHLNKNFSKNKLINRTLQFVWRRTLYKKQIKEWIEWADIVHYTWSPALKNGNDLAYAKKLNKPVFIEWVGSDIRNPDFLKSINPYYKKAFANGYEYAAFESKKRSEANQKLFSKYHALPVLSPEMSLYINKEFFSEVIQLYQRINLKDFVPQYPEINNRRPTIIHSPSAKITKGSNYIIPVIEELKKAYDFDFIMLHDMSRLEVLERMQKADIFIDQIIIGSYGMAAMEAMSFGKPVMCYIMPEVFEAGLPATCPIVNTNPDNLKEKLVELITNPQLRHELGKKSRVFAEEHHDVDKAALHLSAIYKNALSKIKK